MAATKPIRLHKLFRTLVEIKQSRLEQIIRLIDKPISKAELERAVAEIGIDISERTLFRDLGIAESNGLIKKCKTGLYIPANWSNDVPCDKLQVDANYLGKTHAEN